MKLASLIALIAFTIALSVNAVVYFHVENNPLVIAFVTAILAPIVKEIILELKPKKKLPPIKPPENK